MAKTLRVRTATGWVTKPVEDLPENRLIAEEIDDNFLAVEGQVTSHAGSTDGHPKATTSADGLMAKEDKIQLNAVEAQTNLMGGFKNKIINGNFRIWQRGTSQTISGYGSDDRWNNLNSGSTKTHSRQTHPVGEERGGSPYFSRTVVTSVAGASNYVVKQQKIEDVSVFAGQTVTLSFDAKADAPKTIAASIHQNFGTDGSTVVESIGVTHFNLTTAWQRFTVTVQIPSIAGKTVGAGNFLSPHFWFDAGSDHNARTNSLGQQSGTFDICAVQLEEDSVATAFEQRPVGIELMLCQRYFEIVYGVVAYSTTRSTLYNCFYYKVEKRIAPTLGTPAFNAGTGGAFTLSTGSPNYCYQLTEHSTASGFSIAVDAEL